MGYSRQESELIIAVVVIGRCLNLQIVQIILVPVVRNTVSLHFCSSCAALYCACVNRVTTNERYQLTEANLRICVVDKVGASCIPDRRRWRTSSD